MDNTHITMDNTMWSKKEIEKLIIFLEIHSKQIKTHKTTLENIINNKCELNLDIFKKLRIEYLDIMNFNDIYKETFNLPLFLDEITKINTTHNNFSELFENLKLNNINLSELFELSRINISENLINSDLSILEQHDYLPLTTIPHDVIAFNNYFIVNKLIYNYDVVVPLYFNNKTKKEQFLEFIKYLKISKWGRSVSGIVFNNELNKYEFIYI